MRKSALLLILVLLFYGTTTYAQTKQLKGKIADKASGQALTGASIALKGSTKTVTSGATGEFTLAIPANGTVTLVVTYVGYKTLEVNATGKSQLNIFLEVDASALADVVTIGYGTVNRRDLTGSVSSVTAKQLRDIPINSAAQALAGRLAGVQVTAAEGSLDATVKIRVRGGGSITQDNSPLYIIDGIQVEEGLSALSPQDIESIDVLKDASTTAIYGARGANGVIIITTKGGKEMQTRVNYNGFVGVNILAKELEVLNPYDFVRYQFERSRGSVKDSTSFALNYGTFDSIAKFRNVEPIDWQKRLMGEKALMQTHNISITGGTKTTKFNVSYSRNDQAAIISNSNLKRNLLNIKLDHIVSDKFRFGVNVRYNNQITTGAGVSDPTSASFNNLRQVVKYKPFNLNSNIADDQYDQDYYTETTVGNGLQIINPLALFNAQYRKNETNLVNLSGYGSYNISPSLTLRSSVGAENTRLTQKFFDDAITPNAQANSSGQPIAGVYDGTIKTMDISTTLTYSNARSKSAFRKKNDLSVLLGNEYYQYTRNAMTNRFKLYPTGISAENALNQPTLGSVVPTYPQAIANQSKILSFFGRVNYTYNRRFLGTFTFRADGSSKFAPGKNWGYFPSGAVAYKLSEEKFMKKFTSISDLKFRFSYGISGNNRIDDYLYQTVFNATALYALNGNLNSIGLAIPYLNNPNLKWETTLSRNIGMDLSLWKNRVQISVDAYQNNTRDLLLRAPVSFSSGYNIQLQNKGETQNRGIELQVAGTIINSKQFNWSANFNISHNQNKIVKLLDQQQFYLQSSGWSVTSASDYIVKVGEEVGSIFGYESAGFYKVDDFDYDPATTQYTLKKGVADPSKVIGVAQPGLMKFADINGDGVLTDADRKIIGQVNPTFTGGLNQTFTYKNFDASVFVNFSVGGKILNANKVEFTNGYTPNSNVLAIMNNRWRTVDDNGNVLQRIATVGGKSVAIGVDPATLAAANANATLWFPGKDATGFFPTSWAVEDGSFLRINNVSVGYTFSPAILRKIKSKSLRIYATANNLAIITHYTGYDPEVDTRRSNPTTPGVDYSAYPRSRTYIVGVNLSL